MGMEAGEKTKQSFGRRLRAFRERAGVSAEDMGRRLGIHPNSVYRLERGDQWVGADVLERIGAELGLDLARLFTDEKPQPTPQEALEVLAKVIAAPVADPLAARVARLKNEDVREAIEAALDAAETPLLPTQPDKGLREKSK